jgi:hypothetical protein
MYSYVVKISYFSRDDIVQIIDVKTCTVLSVISMYLCAIYSLSLFLYVSNHVQLQYESCNVKLCSNTSVSI